MGLAVKKKKEWYSSAPRRTSERGLRESAGGSKGRLPPGPRMLRAAEEGRFRRGIFPSAHGGMGGT